MKCSTLTRVMIYYQGQYGDYNMKPNWSSATPTRAVAWTLAALLLLAAGQPRAEPASGANQAIRHLIEFVSNSNLTFIRNGSRYTSAEASAHIEKKYRHFMNDIATPEDFIDLCVSRSLLTGKPYMVVDTSGSRWRTSDWLRAELAAYRGRAH